MAEPTSKLLEADGGGQYGSPVTTSFDFTSPGSIFGLPGSLLSTAAPINPIGAGFLSGAGTTFGTPLSSTSAWGDISNFQSPGAFTFINPMQGVYLDPNRTGIYDPYRTTPVAPTFGPSGGTLSSIPEATTTAADMSGVTLAGTPYRNVTISGSQPVSPAGALGQTVSTANAGDAVVLDRFKVNETTGPTFLPPNYTVPPITGGNALLGDVTTTSAGGGGVTVLPPFNVTDTNLPKATFEFTGPSQVTPGATGTPGGSDVVTAPTVTVTGDRVTNPNPFTSQDYLDLLNKATANWGKTPIQLGPITANPNDVTDNSRIVVDYFPPQPPPPQNPIVGPTVTVPPPQPPPPPPPNPIVPPLNFGGVGTAIPSGGTTTTTSAMTQRDLEAELGKSLAALQKYQPQMLGMYSSIYNQFMPESLKAASTSALSQLQADEAKLARLRAGQLSPEDVRQSQQAAREAYGARGQVMGPGAIGAEILNRENIRQQREDQARAAYQASMGNLFNTANLQTGNIFNPIASLISGSFNPLGAYPADVYGTNVNAQLAREIAQKNYEAAVKSAELSGSAQRSGATTSAIGSILGAPGVAKGVMSLFGMPLPACMPGDQCIDTPNGPVEIQKIKGGDIVIGYNGEPAYVAQVSSWNQDPFRAFFTFTFEDGSKFTVCDDHKILNIPAMEWAEGAEMGGRKIVKIETSTGHTTSYDLMTNQGGYQINGVPVNSMIPEIILAAAKHVASVNEKIAAITK